MLPFINFRRVPEIPNPGSASHIALTLWKNALPRVKAGPDLLAKIIININSGVSIEKVFS